LTTTTATFASCAHTLSVEKKEAAGIHDMIWEIQQNGNTSHLSQGEKHVWYFPEDAEYYPFVEDAKLQKSLLKQLGLVRRESNFLENKSSL
jgi:hypothetical protein